MKSSQILKKARKLIESGEEEFICIAVKRVARESFLPPQCTIPIIRYIDKQLEGYAGLGSWLEDTKDIRAFDDPEKLQQTRLNWIDWVIAAYKEKGD